MNIQRKIVATLIEQLIHRPVTLGELADKLDNPNWIAHDAISIVDKIAGLIPVSFDLENTVFVLPVTGDVPHAGPWAIYVKVEGKISLETFKDVIYRRTKEESILTKRVLEIGMAPEEI